MHTQLLGLGVGVEFEFILLHDQVRTYAYVKRNLLCLTRSARWLFECDCHPPPISSRGLALLGGAVLL